MKRSLRHYLKFSHAERMGLAALCLAIAILVIAKAIKHFAPAHVPDHLLEAKTNAMQSPGESPFANVDLPEHQDKNSSYSALPDTVDVNAADSATLVQLIGIGPVIAHKILVHRKTNGPFTSVDQIHEVGAFSKTTLDVLSRHLRFASSTRF